MSIPALTRSAPFYVAMDKGFFRHEGIRVEVTVPTTGKAGVQMLAAGSVDLAGAGGMPVIEAILDGQSLWILAALSLDGRYIGLVVPADVERFEQLKGKRVAVTSGTTPDLFVHTMLLGAGLTRTDVTWVGMRPHEMPHAFANGHVDAAGTFGPFLTQTATALPGARILYADGTFLDHWLLIASPALVRSTPETVRKVLSALVRALHYIHQHPEESKGIVARHLTVPQHDWDHADFRIQLDSVIAQTLTAHASVIQGGRQDLPDFQRYFYYPGLQAVLQSTATVAP
jgi:NitT/TauT family transport system substrate-binding protein